MGALSRAQAPKVRISDTELGRKGFLGYLRLLSGGMVKITPSDGGASEAQATGKGLRVVCGANTSCLEDRAWITEKMAMADTCEVRVSPNTSVAPNLGGIELAEALARVIPFAAGKKDERPVLQCVQFVQKEGMLTLASADGYRLATLALDFEDGEASALIPADELKGMVSALKRAKRVRLAFEPDGIGDHNNLVIETEAIRYKWGSEVGTYPDFEKLIPTEAKAEARFDTRELVKAGMAVASLFQGKTQDATVRLYIGEGQIRLASTDEGGEATIEAQTEGEAKTAISARYLAQVLKALGGMAEVKVNSPSEPILFTVDGYRVVVMPIFVQWGDEPQAPTEAEAPTEPVAEAEAPTEPVAEVEAPAEDKPKRSRKAKEPVAVEA